MIIRLIDAAKKLRISTGTVVEILNDAGFKIAHRPLTRLSKAHVDVLANKYLVAVKDYQKKSQSLKADLSINEIERLQQFFRNFIAHPTPETDIDFLGAIIDESLFKDYFVALITRNPDSKEKQIWIKGLKLFKYKIQAKFTQAKSIILSIITAHFYYIFTDE
jgi:hypothetical protein